MIAWASIYPCLDIAQYDGGTPNPFWSDRRGESGSGQNPDGFRPDQVSPDDQSCMNVSSKSVAPR